MKKRHILEKTSRGGRIAYLACGRKQDRNHADYIGTFWVERNVWVDTVTCKQCRNRYTLGPAAPPQSAEQTSGGALDPVNSAPAVGQKSRHSQ